MTEILLLISFIMHIVLLFIVYKLFQQLNALKQSKNDDLEHMLDTFLQEIREENEALRHQVKEKSNHKTTAKVAEKKSYYTKKEEPVAKLEMLEMEEKKDDFTPTIQGQVYQLLDEGLAVEEIAKRLNRGKTEIELIVKFKEQIK